MPCGCVKQEGSRPNIMPCGCVKQEGAWFIRRVNVVDKLALPTQVELSKSGLIPAVLHRAFLTSAPAATSFSINPCSILLPNVNRARIYRKCVDCSLCWARSEKAPLAEFVNLLIARNEPCRRRASAFTTSRKASALTTSRRAAVLTTSRRASALTTSRSQARSG